MNLARLIGVHRGQRTYEALAKDCNGGLTSQRLQQIATAPIKAFLQPETMAALARGLRVPVAEVVMATAESLGLDVQRNVPAVLSYLPASVGELDEADLILIGQIADRLSRGGGGRDGGSTAPIAERLKRSGCRP